MDQSIGRLCPHCKKPFSANDEIVVCDHCSVPHHKKCWAENNGCATFRCPASNQPFLETPPENIERGKGAYCIHCGTFVPEKYQFCTQCGNKMVRPGKPDPSPQEKTAVPELTSTLKPVILDLSPVEIKEVEPQPLEEYAETSLMEEEERRELISKAQKVIIIFLALVIVVLVIILSRNILSKNPQTTTPESVEITPSPTAEIIETQTSTTSVQIPIMTDDFSTHDNRWPESTDPGNVTDYQDGYYHIQVNNPNNLTWVTDGYNIADLQIDVDTKRLQGPETSNFGLICRYVDNQNFYMALITSDQRYWISRNTNGSQSFLGNGEIKSSSDIHAGSVENHVRLVCSGSTISLYANDILLESVDDFSFTTGDFGMIVGTDAEGGADVAFDNLVVSKP
jgi:hypothetical protein